MTSQPQTFQSLFPHLFQVPVGFIFFIADGSMTIVNQISSANAYPGFLQLEDAMTRAIQLHAIHPNPNYMISGCALYLKPVPAGSTYPVAYVNELNEDGRYVHPIFMVREPGPFTPTLTRYRHPLYSGPVFPPEDTKSLTTK